MESTEARAPPKRAGQDWRRVFSRKQGQFFQFQKRLRNYGKFSEERTRDGKADQENTVRWLESGNDIVVVFGSWWIEIWETAILYENRQGWPAI